MRISSPPFLWPCYFGTDVPERSQLMATGRTVEEMCRIIGADSLAFFPGERLPETIPDSCQGYCEGCFTHKYPYGIEDEEE